MKKNNLIYFALPLLSFSLLIGLVLPLFIKLLFGVFIYPLCIVGLIGILSFLILFTIEMHQDNKKVPHYKKNLLAKYPFDPEKQLPVMKCSICTGERVAGFKDISSGHITEIMVIRSDEDLQYFKKQYNIDNIQVEY